MIPAVTMLPPYGQFRRVCQSGLAQVRPLTAAAKAEDRWGWNFGAAWPPSYSAYGRMRALTTFLEARALHPRSVLEIAAGDAALCACLASEGCRVTANDLRQEHLEMAVRNFENGGDIKLQPGNLFDLDPAVVGVHDLVIACEIVEHVAHTDEFLKQLRRFVAPGGRLLLSTPNGAYFRNTLPTHSMIKDFTVLETQQFKPDADGHLFLITPEEMAGLAERAGFRVERMCLWATPLITGHAGMGRLGRVVPFWFCHAIERLAQHLPMSLKSRFCFSLIAVLTPC